MKTDGTSCRSVVSEKVGASYFINKISKFISKLKNGYIRQEKEVNAQNINNIFSGLS
jgi:hypothetical protein